MNSPSRKPDIPSTEPKNYQKSFSSLSRPRILCVVDGPNWIFNRHVNTLKHFLGNDFDLITHYRGQPYQEAEYDLIYPLEFDMVSAEEIKNPTKYITGIRSYIAWADWDFLELVNYLVGHFQNIHVVSRQLMDVFSPYIPYVQYVSHGVDTEFFTPTQSQNEETGKLRLGWAGNRKTHVKGFRRYITPLSAIAGVELVYCGYSDTNLAYQDMLGFYHSIDAYISASSFEGNNNSIMEAAAMERAIISTTAGAVTEYLKDNESALFVNRDIEQIKSGVLRLRDDPALRIRLGKQARKDLLSHRWDWSERAEDYKRFFNGALQNPSERIQTRFEKPVDLYHYGQVLETQFHLSRDLRIGYALRVIDLEQQIQQLESVIVSSENIRFVEFLKRRFIKRLSSISLKQVSSRLLKVRKN